MVVEVNEVVGVGVRMVVVQVVLLLAVEGVSFYCYFRLAYAVVVVLLCRSQSLVQRSAAILI